MSTETPNATQGQSQGQAPTVVGQAGPSRKKKAETKEDREHLLNAWKAIVEVQMHFNDMLMRIRNLAVTLILAVFGGAALSLQYELYFELSRFRFHLAALIITFGLVAWAAMWSVDRYYHKLLVGAVSKSSEIEDTYDEDWLGMTHAISHESRKLFGCPEAMTARRQMALFLYSPILGIGLLFLLAVLFSFQANYVREPSSGASGRAVPAQQVPRMEPRPSPSDGPLKRESEGVPPIPPSPPRK